MATDKEGDTVMEHSSAKSAAEAEENEEKKVEEPAVALAETEENEEKKEEEPVGPSPEETVSVAEKAKEDGNLLLKSGDLAGAVSKYLEGIDLMRPLLDKGESEFGGELRSKGRAVYLALRLNAAQACIKQCSWTEAAEHADKALDIDADNAKALYRRGTASLQFDSESRLEQARSDFARFAQLEPTNKEARLCLQQAKERLKDVRQKEKERYAVAMKGGLYEENHRKLERMRLEYDEEVKRRKDAEEDEISWEDWQKKITGMEEAAKKKEKEERETRAKEAAQEEEQRDLDEANKKRREEGLEDLSLEEWRESKRRAVCKDEVVKTDELELDEEEKKLLQEAKNKGYYHGRLGTVLSDAAPKPQQVEESALGGNNEESEGRRGSVWNQSGGTWEERDTTAWCKDKLTSVLKDARVLTCEKKSQDDELFSVSAAVTTVKSVTGDAQIINVRNKQRCGYNFEAALSFRITVVSLQQSADQEEKPEPKKFDGSLTLPELSDTVQPRELRIEAKWKKSAPPECLQSIISECLAELKVSVQDKVIEFLTEYQAL